MDKRQEQVHKPGENKRHHAKRGHQVEESQPLGFKEHPGSVVGVDVTDKQHAPLRRTPGWQPRPDVLAGALGDQ